MNPLSQPSNVNVTNKKLKAYLAIYNDIQDTTLEHISQFGLPLEQENNQKENYFTKINQLNNKGALVRNNCKSVVSNGKISSACEACQTGTGSYTSFISLKCHRDCYFCFNENQDNYHFYLNNQRNANQELSDLIQQGVNLTHLALTGGEPLLHPEETIKFFKLAQELTPQSHTRLYTTGDFLTKEILQQLKDASLDELRFSIKLEDSKQKQKHILRQIELANQYIPIVMVEMPVMPGTREGMKELLIQLDRLNIFGINLLELCFPFRNANKFKENGFELKNPPYDVYYNFWYAGGLAIAESERLSLELVDFAIEQNLQLGVHYCSLENKFTGQIYQQNFDAKLDKTYQFSSTDYYFKTAKVFGSDKNKVKSILKKHNFPFTMNSDYDFIQFPTDAIELIQHTDVEILLSSNVVENDGQGQNIREVHVEVLTTK
ncbi:radical SAM protein [Bacillus massiliigorillae]|uniref:radical SAM protein n=1 Tax=Bacillus massiliigorillae TaxID=1243664 RepID=UPI0003AADA4F|nr:radical SAM protein [Bacillus massiliigorillae]